MGVLDGHTILRFTHSYDFAGGVEQYLGILNKALLDRNRMTIVQLNLPHQSIDAQPQSETIGLGRLIQVPMTPEVFEEPPLSSLEDKSVLQNLLWSIKNFGRDHLYYNKVSGPLFQSVAHPIPFRKYNREPCDVGPISQKIFNTHRVSLVIVHLAGGRGGFEIIREARGRNIPCVIVNHFSNEWLKRSGIREQAKLVKGVGGVSEKGVPGYIRKRYFNVSDGIDLKFFSNDPSVGKNGPQKFHSILLVSRLVPNKGHVDLLKAMRILKTGGLTVNAVLAGRIDDRSFLGEIERMIDSLELKTSVKIVGKLSQNELKIFYQKSKIVVLPSYSEGLGRVLLEAQSMGVPVVAYDTGGVTNALQNNISGYLVKKGDLNNLASKLRRLLGDPGLRKIMGDNGRAFVVENFSLQRLCERHEEWYINNIINTA